MQIVIIFLIACLLAFIMFKCYLNIGSKKRSTKDILLIMPLICFLAFAGSELLMSLATRQVESTAKQVVKSEKIYDLKPLNASNKYIDVQSVNGRVNLDLITMSSKEFGVYTTIKESNFNVIKVVSTKGTPKMIVKRTNEYGQGWLAKLLFMNGKSTHILGLDEFSYQIEVPKVTKQQRKLLTQ